MNQLDTFRFPFLGARESGEPFEYLLLDINQEKACIAIFKWMVNHTNLHQQEKIDLFIPSFLTPTYKFRKNVPGIVNSIRKEEVEQGHFYEIYFNHETPPVLPAHGPKELALNLASESSLTEMLIQLIKDSIILKQGMLVYLKHFAPYFSRIVNKAHQDYQSVEKFIFDDLKNRITTNEKGLNDLYLSLKDIKNSKDIPLALDLEYLRENIESEINLDLFLVAFASIDSRHELIELLKDPSYQNTLKLKYSYMNYLMAIKDLEKRLYSNYNQIVLIYLKVI